MMIRHSRERTWHWLEVFFWTALTGLLIIVATARADYKPSLAVCAPGDTCVYFADIRGPLALPETITETPIVMVWSTTVQPAIIAETRPIMEMVADSLGVETEQATGLYFFDRFFCSVIKLMVIDGVPSVRIQPEDNVIREYPLDRVRVYSTGRVNR